ncbi:hypothetical protein [Chelativorans sp.]|uniref:hypothetical protein n=1 Tax=Chelativorans sp. TaxID=2203393 RepID=UPI002811EBBC|nr:hypothetical protein [Chelativorans sp.]
MSGHRQSPYELSVEEHDKTAAADVTRAADFSGANSTLLFTTLRQFAMCAVMLIINSLNAPRLTCRDDAGV